MTREEKIKKIEEYCEECDLPNYCNQCKHNDFRNPRNLNDEELDIKIKEVEDARRYEQKSAKLLTYCYSSSCDECKLSTLCNEQSWVGADEKKLDMLITVLNEREENKKEPGMKDTMKERKERIGLILEILKKTLKETNTFIGITLDKNNIAESKIVFLDRRDYVLGNKNGFSISLDKLNGFEEEQDDKCR